MSEQKDKQQPQERQQADGAECKPRGSRSGRGRGGKGGRGGSRRPQDDAGKREAADKRAEGSTRGDNGGSSNPAGRGNSNGGNRGAGSRNGNNQQRGSGRGSQQRNSGRRREPQVPNKGEHILFVGFMGCGKSSVSRVLAKRAGLPLIDVDKYIEKQEGRKIKEIFAEEGEEGFRRIETMTLASLAFEPKSIISCGGGIVGSAVNRAIVKALGNVVYLKVPCDEAIGRISDPSTRPMLSGPRPVREIYDERLPLYRDVADITINTSGKSVGANVQQVIGALRRRGLL